METVPLAHLASVRVAFERDPLLIQFAEVVAALCENRQDWEDY